MRSQSLALCARARTRLVRKESDEEEEAVEIIGGVGAAASFFSGEQFAKIELQMGNANP